MGCVAVIFNYDAWVARYPEFSAITQAQAQEFFNEATVYWANPSRVVSMQTTQSVLLNMLTAHIAALYTQCNGTPSSTDAPVGRINSATEGSVSVQTAYDSTNPEQWYAQTKYGASFWSATAQYRTARYVRGQLQPGASGPGLFGYNGWPQGGW